MKKVFLILISVIAIIKPFQVYGFEYDPLLMRAQASMFPKIILLDKDIENKAVGDEVKIEILHMKKDAMVAKRVKGLIENKYKNKLGSKTLIIELIDFSSFNFSTVATAYIVLKGDSDYHSSVTDFASKHNRLVFGYDYRDFSNNVLVSVLMKEKTYIYLNKSAIHSYGINFQPLFYKIVKVIE